MKWTDEDIKFLQDNFQSMTKAELADSLERSEAAVWSKMRHLGLTEKTQSVKLTRLQSRYISQNADLSDEELAKDLEIDVDIIREARAEQRGGVTKAKQGGKGKIDELMARQKENGVVVMTEAASQVSDDLRHDLRGNKKTQPWIHKIYD